LIASEEPHGMGNVIIVVDDEVVIRKSTIRMLLKYCDENGKDLNILEAGDGIECLSLYYKCYKDGINVVMIISDQTMNFLNGSDTARILHNLNSEKGLSDIPFYILTAYEGFTLGSGIIGTYTKPLIKKNIEDIFSKSNVCRC
jgi:CheY-like chemotaxis protein